ncbi:hypothetical protein AOLI_G00200370 [Acnodon oligacanthus]
MSSSGTELRVTALLKKQKELLQQKSQLESACEVFPVVVAPASSFRTLRDAILTLAPHGPWERQHCRGTCRPLPLPQPIFTSCNRFGTLGSPPMFSPMSRASTQDRNVIGPPRESKQPCHCLLFSSEVLKEHYQTLLDTARKKTDARIVISGPLPTYRRGFERFRRLFALQSWLPGWCTFNSLDYVDNWSSFWEQPALYRRDGFHSSRLGSAVLSQNIEKAIH